MENLNELEMLRQELQRVQKEFNDYKILIQCKVLPEAETYKYMVRYAKDDMQNLQCLNDSLLNFIAENGLGEKYYNQFVAEGYPYDVLDFTNKNEVVYSEFEKEQFLGRVRYVISKVENKN